MSKKTIGLLFFVALASAHANADTNADPKHTITIKRDNYGVPHVYADEAKGLFYGYGYVVAEDRLFQMEMARRSVLGTVAEVLGEDYLSIDKTSRAGFDPASIKSQLLQLSPDDYAILESYAQGFNARVKIVLANQEILLPKQFIDAGFLPSDTWSAYDVAMIWIGTMANRFSNGSSEIANLKLLNQLKAAKGDVIGLQLFNQLRWVEDPLAPTTVPRQKSDAQNSQASLQESWAQSHHQRLNAVSDSIFIATTPAEDARRGIALPENRPISSNLWIASPKKTTDGSTILINGPQFGWVNPSYVYGIGLHGAGFDVVGNSPFAHPMVLFGTNGKISWGSTAGPLDVNDIYQEKLNPLDQYQYIFNGKELAMSKRSDIIKVKDKPDEILDTYSTVHGIVSSFDLENNTAYSMRRSWNGYEVASMVAWINSTKAQNFDEWREQALKMATTINWYYADSSGNIGYISPGRLPIRPSTQDIRLPALGDGSMEWLGIHPAGDAPFIYNPEQGYIANWNNQSAPAAVADGANYSVVDRVHELIERLEAKPKLTPQELWDLNKTASFVDLNARYFIPYIVDATAHLKSSNLGSIEQSVYLATLQLESWNGLSQDPDATGFYDDPAVTLIRTWLPLMYRELLADDLPADVFAQYADGGYLFAKGGGSLRPGNGSRLLYNALLGDKAGVPQEYDFFNGADKNALILATFTSAVTQLNAQFGTDILNWKTAVIPQDFYPNNFMGAPQANKDEHLTLPLAMNRGTQNDRVIFKGEETSLCTVAPPGQSGFIAPDGTLSKHYADQMDLYKTFGCKFEALNDDELKDNIESVYTLYY